jgi:hypothetical protein
MKETVNNSGYKVFAPTSLALWENILFVAENAGEVIDAYNISSQV